MEFIWSRSAPVFYFLWLLSHHFLLMTSIMSTFTAFSTCLPGPYKLFLLCNCVFAQFLQQLKIFVKWHLIFACFQNFLHSSGDAAACCHSPSQAPISVLKQCCYWVPKWASGKMACSLWPVVLAVHYQCSCLLETVQCTCPDMQHFLSPYRCSLASSHLTYLHTLSVGFPFLKLRARVG